MSASHALDYCDCCGRHVDDCTDCRVCSGDAIQPGCGVTFLPAWGTDTTFCDDCLERREAAENDNAAGGCREGG